METEFKFKYNKILLKDKYLRKKVFPQMMKDEKMNEYLDLKINYQKLLRKLLIIRSEFTKKLMVDIVSSVYTLQDVAPWESAMDNIANSVVTERRVDRHKRKWIDLRRKYHPKFAWITLFSLFWGWWMGVGIYFSKYYQYLGAPIIISKTFAFAIIVVVVFLMFFISFDLLTLIREKWRGRWLGWLDYNLSIHKFWGYLITLYGICHSWWHLFGTFIIISKSNDSQISDLNDSFDSKGKRKYYELLFCTLTGVTGLILLVVIWIIAATSLQRIREK